MREIAEWLSLTGALMRRLAFAVLIGVLVLSLAFTVVAGESFSGLVINEFMADNDAAVGGPYMTFPDWIEFYNGGISSIDLSGMYLTEELGVSSWEFPNGTIMAPGSFLLVWGGRGSGAGMLHTNFSPNAGGGTLTLLAADGVTVLDQVSFDKQIRDVSYGRYPDGGSSWNYIVNSTPGAANVENPQNDVSTSWPMWAFIVAVLALCLVYVLVRKPVGRSVEK